MEKEFNIHFGVQNKKYLIFILEREMGNMR